MSTIREGRTLFQAEFVRLLLPITAWHWQRGRRITRPSRRWSPAGSTTLH